MELHSSRLSELDIDRLYDFLIENKASRKTAGKAFLKIKEGAQSLIDNPELGINMNDGTNRQELHIPFGKGEYVLRYIPDYDANIIYLLRIWHSNEIRD